MSEFEGIVFFRNRKKVHEIEPGVAEIRLRMTLDRFNELQFTQTMLSSPNLESAVYNACLILNNLYRYRNTGEYEVEFVVKNRTTGGVARFGLP